MSVEFEQGHFTADIEVSLAAAMLRGLRDDSQELTRDVVAEYLAILPSGTTIIETAPMQDVVGLFLKTRVRFFNLLLAQVKRVELQKGRGATMLNDTIHQYDVITGMKYFDENGKELFV